MLGMVRPNQPNPNIPPPASQQPQQAALPPQQTNVHAALPLPGQTDLKDHIKSGQNHPASMGHSMLRGHEPPRQSLYQGGSPHLGMEFNQTGGPMQAERGSSWIPGLRDNTTGTQNIPGPPSFMAGQMGPASQPPRPPALSSDMESALLQQVMSLTPEQINLLPLEQRNQVLQLQQIWGYFVGPDNKQRAAVSNLETNGTAATNIADIDAGAALTDRRERELEEELRQKLGRKELEDDEQKLIGGFQHMLSNMYLFSNYVLAVSSGALSLLTKGPQCWMFVTIISFVVIFLIGMVLSLQLTYRQLRALQTKMNSLVEKRNQICPDTKNLELEYESRHCDINLLIFLVVGLMYAGFVLVMGYYLLCSESVNGLSYTPCVPGPHQTVPVESVPDHLLVSPWLPRKFLHQAVPLEPVADHVPFSPCVPSLRPCADM